MSDWGGSGVVTLALKILADNRIDLPNHAVYLYHPTTRPSKTVQLALNVGLKGDDITKKSGYMPSEVIGRMVMLDTPISKITRLKHDKNYTGENITGNAVSTTSKAAGLGLGAVGAITLSAPVAAGIGGAALFAIGVINKDTKAMFPKAHKNIAKRFS